MQAEFFGEAAVGAGYRGFVPVRVGAAGVRPEAGGVVFGKGALLDQDVVAREDEDRDGLVAQAKAVGFELVGRGEGAVDPGGDERHDGPWGCLGGDGGERRGMQAMTVVEGGVLRRPR